MPHLRLVPPLPADDAATDAAETTVTPLAFFQVASGMCLCRACTMKRHPAYAGR